VAGLSHTADISSLILL